MIKRILESVSPRLNRICSFSIQRPGFITTRSDLTCPNQNRRSPDRPPYQRSQTRRRPCATVVPWLEFVISVHKHLGADSLVLHIKRNKVISIEGSLPNFTVWRFPATTVCGNAVECQRRRPIPVYRGANQKVRVMIHDPMMMTNVWEGSSPVAEV
jgi:hypothetical protein